MSTTNNPIFNPSEKDPNFLFAQKQNVGPNSRNQRQRTPAGQKIYPWISAKRKRTSPKQKPKAKQVKITDYWLNPQPETSNRYENLSEDDSPPTIIEKPAKKTPKPPPIFIGNAKCIKPLIELLKNTVKDEYQLKVLGNDEVKLQVNTIIDYRLIVAELDKKKTEFHSYKLKDQKNFRTVLRGIHPSVDTADIKGEIEQLNHKVVNIYNIKQRSTGKPLPLFYVDLETNDNNKEIYTVRALMHTKITFEAPHQKKELPQCTKCQRYDHTQKYCHRDPRCVKCAGDHLTKDCSRKVKDKHVKCVLCSENHSANYKGCKIYKELREKKFPHLRNKQSQKNPPGFAQPSYQLRQPNLSYAQVVSDKQEPLLFASQNGQVSHNQSDDICELKNMMKDMMKQIIPLVNLLTTLVSKMV